jgi:hypothetical protein
MFEQTVLDNKTLLCIIFCRYHDELISNGLLVPLSGTIEGDKNSDGETTHYVTPKGVSSLVKHFINKSGKFIILSKNTCQS